MMHTERADFSRVIPAMVWRESMRSRQPASHGCPPKDCGHDGAGPAAGRAENEGAEHSTLPTRLPVAVGLALVIALFRLRVTVDTDQVDLLKR